MQLSFTVPDETTDGGTMRSPLTVVLCRITNPPSGPCSEVVRKPVRPGAESISDAMPADLASGAPRLLEYQLEVLNAQGRGAGPSDPVFAAAGSAPPAMGPLSVAPQRNAAQITWRKRPDGSLDQIRVHRSLISTVDGPVKTSARKKSSPAAPETPRKTQKDVTLMPGPDAASDPGGLLDRSIHDGDTVTYVGRRVLPVKLAVPAVTVAGKKGGTRQIPASTETFELQGEPSPPVTFTFHDTLPPAAPTGLAAIPGGGFGQPSSVDLSWESNPEDDVIGYNVYRAEGSAPGGSSTRLNGSPVPGPSYRDLTAQPGHAYRYTVTAVDARGNESARSTEVVEQINP